MGGGLEPSLVWGGVSLKVYTYAARRHEDFKTVSCCSPPENPDVKLNRSPLWGAAGGGHLAVDTPGFGGMVLTVAFSTAVSGASGGGPLYDAKAQHCVPDTRKGAQRYCGAGRGPIRVRVTAFQTPPGTSYHTTRVCRRANGTPCPTHPPRNHPVDP